MNDPHKRTSSKVVYQNPWIKVREDEIIHPNGKPGIYGVIEAGEASFIVALDDHDCVYLVKQFRYPTKTNSYEVPAGHCEKESPLITAQRELQEETGIQAEQWDYLGAYNQTNGVMDGTMHIYMARRLTIDPSFTVPAEEGIAQLTAFPLHEALNMVTSGEIVDAETAFALLLAKEYLSKNSS